MDSANVPLGPCRIEVVSRDSEPQSLFATYEETDKPISVAPHGPQQMWDITPASDEGGYNIRALEVDGNIDQSYLRNDYTKGSVLLGQRHFLRIGRDQESGAYTISGPYRAGTYGANDWIGVIDKKLVTRTRHDPKQTDLESYLWRILPQ